MSALDIKEVKLWALAVFAVTGYWMIVSPVSIANGN